MVKVSEIAAEKLKEVISKEKNPENIMLRVEFGGFGWGGPKLQLTLEELKDENDVVVEAQGIKFVYNSGIEEHAANCFVDYSDKGFRRGFTIRGEKTSSCE